ARLRAPMNFISHAAERDEHETRPTRRLSAGLLAGLACAVAFVLVAVAYVAFVLWPRQLSEMPPDAPSVPITIPRVGVNAPPAAIRKRVQRRWGAQDRIDLVFLWPSLEAPDPVTHPDKQAPSDEPHPIDRLFLTIAASDGTLAPAERMKAIYPRYIAGDL